MPECQLEANGLELHQRSNLTSPNILAHVSGALGKLFEAIFRCILLALLPQFLNLLLLPLTIFLLFPVDVEGQDMSAALSSLQTFVLNGLQLA